MEFFEWSYLGTYAGEASEDGWLKIQYADGAGWVSGKYARLEKGAQGEK